MQIIIREVRFSDLEQIFKICQLKGPDLKELQDFRKKYYTEYGESEDVRTGFPDEVLVAEVSGKIVGYLHFYTDCWEGYEKVLVSVGSDLTYSYKDRREIEEKLKQEFQLREP